MRKSDAIAFGIPVVRRHFRLILDRRSQLRERFGLGFVRLFRHGKGEEERSRANALDVGAGRGGFFDHQDRRIGQAKPNGTDAAVVVAVLGDHFKRKCLAIEGGELDDVASPEGQVM